MIAIGDRIPEVTFKTLGSEGLAERASSDMFAGKRVLLVGIPGAFTPVCSDNHLPGYVRHVASFHELDVDEVMCVSVNDSFVMKAFGEAQNASGKIGMIADSDAEFTRRIGMDVDASGFGLGTRSQRYAMLINDGVVEILQAESDFVDLGVTSADHMLGLLRKQLAAA